MIHRIADTRPFLHKELPLTQSNRLGFGPFVVKQHQKARSSQRIQTGPHAQNLTDGDLIPPCDPAIAAGDEFGCRVYGVTI